MTPALRQVLVGGKAAPVPSLVPIYKGTLTTTTDETATVLATTHDIGVPHPKRVIVLACYSGIGGVTQLVTVNGRSIRDANNTAAFQVQVIPLPDGTTAEITLSAVGSLRKAVSVYVAYPNSPFPVSAPATNTQAATTNANVAGLIAQAGGCLIYAGGQNATAGSTWSTTWSGTEAVVEDVDAASEATGSYTMGHINFTVSGTFALDLAETVSGSKQLAALTLGPSYGF